MISETTGWVMLVAGLVLGCVSWIALGVVHLWCWKARLWRAWRKARRGG